MTMPRGFTMPCLFIALLIMLPARIFSADYFISNNGNDSNNGLSAMYPWRTIQKLNSMMSSFIPGDRILFERGGYFVGQINVTCSGSRNEPVTFGAYGAGTDPFISGSLPVKNWKLQSNGIYAAEVDTVVGNLFFNFNQMTTARYPNSGYKKVKSSLRNPRTGFHDNTLSQKDNYWNGSRAIIRTNNWTIEYSKIKAFKGGSVLLTDPTKFDIEKDWGYYIDDKLSLLDTINEWYFEDKGNGGGVLYFKPPPGTDPAVAFTEAAFISIGFFALNEISNIVIRDLRIINQIDYGIYLNGGSTNVRIENCTFYGQIMTALFLPRKTFGASVINCRFRDINGKAVYFIDSRRSLVKECVFENIGMKPGHGTTGTSFGMSALVMLASDSNYAIGNYIHRVGSNAINMIGRGNTVSENVVRSVLLFLNDGGGIKSYGESTSGTVWRNNFVSDVAGNILGTPSRTRYMSYGLYPDAGCRNMLLENNTVERCRGAGIFFYEGCLDNSVSNNICYNNSIALKFRVDNKNSTGNLVKGNFFTGLDESQFATRMIAPAQGFLPGTFEGNTYAYGLNEASFQYETPGRLNEFGMNDWLDVMQGRERSPVFLTGEPFLYPKIFRNMTSDTANYILDPGYDYQDRNQNKVYGSVRIFPWSSAVLFLNREPQGLATFDVISSTKIFRRTEKGAASDPKWFVIASEKLTVPVSLDAPEGFELSFEPDRNFSANLSYTPGQIKADKVIYVRFAPSAERAYYGFIGVKSGNLQRVVRVSGNSR